MEARLRPEVAGIGGALRRRLLDLRDGGAVVLALVVDAARAPGRQVVLLRALELGRRIAAGMAALQLLVDVALDGAAAGGRAGLGVVATTVGRLRVALLHAVTSLSWEVQSACRRLDVTGPRRRAARGTGTGRPRAGPRTWGRCAGEPSMARGRRPRARDGGARPPAAPGRDRPRPAGTPRDGRWRLRRPAPPACGARPRCARQGPPPARERRPRWN